MTAEKAFKGRVTEDKVTRFSPVDYGKIPMDPIDTAVMEHSKTLALVPLEAAWSDVGSWQKLWEISQQDQNGVSMSGDVIHESCKNTFLHSESRLLACAGLENITVVETADAVLVANKQSDDSIRSIVQQLNN